jgi:hypothetical protein
MEKKDKKKMLVYTDPDFIDSPKYNNSLKVAIKNNPEGLPEHKIARMLMTSNEEVIFIINNALAKIRAILTKGDK